MPGIAANVPGIGAIVPGIAATVPRIVSNLCACAPNLSGTASMPARLDPKRAKSAEDVPVGAARVRGVASHLRPCGGVACARVEFLGMMPPSRSARGVGGVGGV